ncbi:hypothetical protein C8R43DRAFT_1128171 [Mycena crocata]|nr:hypothetical protein C8R43DRAFT_1128171 [Mycena crocata]
MPPKKLRFNPTVDEYSEKPTHSDPLPPKRQVRFNPTVEEYEDREFPTPTPNGEPDGTALTPVLHAALSPGDACLQLDFSLPSAIFRASTQLDEALLSEPACTPPVAEVNIRIASVDRTQGICRMCVLHSPKGEAVTVGDVLTTIRTALREPEIVSDQDVQWPHARRLATLEEYETNVDAKTMRAVLKIEKAAGTRRVDRLLGDVQFAGITVEPQCWQLHLRFSERYGVAD